MVNVIRFLILVISLPNLILAQSFLHWQAEKAYSAGNISDAYKIFQDAVKQDPTDSKALYNLGKIAYYQKDFESAEQLFFKAEQFSKNNIQKEQSSFNLGDSLLQQKKYEKSIESYEKVLAINSQNEYASSRIDLAKKLLEKEQQDKQNQDKQENNKQNQDKQDDNQSENRQDKQNQDKSDNQNKDKNNQDKSKDKQDKNNQEQDKGSQEQEENNKGQESVEQSEKKSNQQDDGQDGNTNNQKGKGEQQDYSKGKNAKENTQESNQQEPNAKNHKEPDMSKELDDINKHNNKITKEAQDAQDAAREKLRKNAMQNQLDNQAIKNHENIENNIKDYQAQEPEGSANHVNQQSENKINSIKKPVKIKPVEKLTEEEQGILKLVEKDDVNQYKIFMQGQVMQNKQSGYEEKNW